MFTLGIPKRDYRRASQVLGYESAEEIVFNATLQDDGFYIFTFPEVGDAYNFRKIANKLKSEGVRVVGADAQLTEKKIMKLASLINLTPLQEIDINDPALMRARAAKDKMNQMKSNPRISYDQALDLRIVKRDLEKKIKNKFKEMQNDPDIEPEGGPVADDYGDQLNRLEDRLYKIDKQIASYDMSERTDAIATARALPKDDRDEEDERNDQNLAQDDTRFERMNEAKIKTKEEFNKRASAEQKAMEKKWDSLVTDIALKKSDPKKHTANMEAKQEYLTNLNKAGKLKKDYTADQIENWSIASSMFGWDIASTVLPTPKVALNEVATELGYLNETEGQVLQVTTNNGEVALITDPRDIKDFLSGGGLVYGTDDSGASIELSKETSMDIQMIANEGSCGYGPDGVPGNTPGETKGMPADDRTKSIIKKLIQKEIKKLSEADPEAIKGKHYPDEETVKKLKKGPYASGGQNAQK